MGGGPGLTAPLLGAGNPWCHGMGGGLAVPFAWPGSCGDKDTKRSLACLPAWAVPSPSGRVGEHWGRVTSFLGSLGSSACTFVIAGWLLNIGSASGFGVWGGSSHVCSAPLREGLLGTRGHRGRQLASLPPGTVIVGCLGADQVPGGGRWGWRCSRHGRKQHRNLHLGVGKGRGCAQSCCVRAGLQQWRLEPGRPAILCPDSGTPAASSEPGAHTGHPGLEPPWGQLVPGVLGRWGACQGDGGRAQPASPP